MTARRFVAACVAAASLCAAPARAGGVCDDAFSAAPDLVKRGQLRAARDALMRCSSEGCPEAMRAICSEDLRQIEPRLPTVVFVAKGAGGADFVDVRVLEGGRLVQERPDGRGVEVDPGVHTFRFERPNDAPIDVQVLVREGEKARQVVATWPAPHEAVAPPPASGAVRPVPWTVYASGAVALVATASFAYFLVRGLGERADLGSCKGTCDHDAVQAVRTNLAVADVSWVVAVLGYAAAATLYVTRPALTPTVGLRF
jgi:hypothetical protein